MKYDINGLNCPACAAKIENKLKLELDPKAVIDINTKTLTLSEDTLPSATKIIQSIEPTVTITPKTKAKKYHYLNASNYSLVAAVISFGLGFLVRPFFLLGFILAGYQVLFSALRGLIRHDFLDEKFLMSLATIAAIAVGEWAEAAAVMILYSIGELFEELASNKTKKSVTSLMELIPEKVRVINANTEVIKSPGEVLLGDLILVKPGERIPLDGVILEGTSLIDTSALTGESLPRAIQKGETVMSGTINQTSPLIIQVTTLERDSTVTRMLKLLEEASLKKAPAERFITRFARYYTPIVVAGALVVFLLFPLLGFGSFSAWGYRALVLLIVSCPCALVISVPLAYFSGLGRASQLGILVKGGEVFDNLNQLDTAIWDKTGTLTSGEFVVVNVKPMASQPRDELLRLAASLELYSNHPLAQAVVKEAQNSPLYPVTNLTELPGFGLEGFIEDQKISVGSLKYIRSLGYELNEDFSNTAIAVVFDNKLLGVIELADKLKPTSKQALLDLKSMGLKTIVLTGDQKQSALDTLKEIDLDDIKAELLPEDKLNYVNELSKKGERAVFVGDGINDAPVLASSYVGIAMGGMGSDAAINASDVVLITDDPSKVPLLLQLSKAVRKKVVSNIALTLSVKFVVIILSLLGYASMWQAVIADVGITIIAILNAASLFKKFN